MSPDPDKLTRATAGSYVSGDGRFEVSQSDAAWYLVDRERTNDFGQELIHGPFATLKEAREAVPGARKITPLARPKRSAAARREAERAKLEPPPPPKSWIDRLPDDEAKAVRRLISALERDGISDAEKWVQESRRAGARSLAAQLIEHRLAGITEQAESDDRRRTREIIRRVVTLLTDDGTLTSAPLPKWAVVELDPDEPLPSRRLRPKT
jgi:hypothetical protein